ncbi:MAG: membrane protein insertion efficiency factor YidD [Eubacteriales bacterium]|jgi:putative membrane protein insertion efficiency factor|nr:membrane protein insertion efficiency factor YidD [Clostridiales bacterium]
MKRLAVCLIRLYQRYISPLKLRPSCRFVPTCSEYAIEAIEKRGFFLGMFLAIWRILRCNPFCKGGVDPVPEKKSKSGDKTERLNDDISRQSDK